MNRISDLSGDGELMNPELHQFEPEGEVALHGMDNFRIEWGDTLRNPRLIEGDHLMKFDIVVANPPFSLDKWGQEDAEKDPFRRYHRGLPANLFFGTGIPAAILLFNKGKTHGDVLFIDASREFKEAKNQNVLTDAHLQKIVDTHRAFQSVEKYACRATPQEIADNDFNLNIPRYVDTFEEEAEIDLNAVKTDITRLESELATVRAKMQAHLEELGL